MLLHLLFASSYFFSNWKKKVKNWVCLFCNRLNKMIRLYVFYSCYQHLRNEWKNFLPKNNVKKVLLLQLDEATGYSVALTSPPNLPKQQSKVILMAKWCHLTMSLRHKMATSGWCHYFKVKMMYYVKVILMSMFDISLTLLISFCHQNDFDLPSNWCQNDVWMRSNWDYNWK